MVEKRPDRLQPMVRRVKGKFPRFVQLVLEAANSTKEVNCNLEKCEADFHWVPYYAQCDYCGLEFDFIGDMKL